MDITPIVKAIITLLCAIITVVVVPYIKSKTTATQQKKINEWIKIAVAAAEQIYKGVGRGVKANLLLAHFKSPTIIRL